MHTRENNNHTVTKFAAFVHVVCDTMCTKFCSIGLATTFDKVTVKNKMSMDLNSRTRERPPSILTGTFLIKRFMVSIICA